MSFKIVLAFLGLIGFSVAMGPLDQPYNPQDFFISRIMNGTEAPEGFAPHMVALVVGGRIAILMCGASIVSYHHVLTAAHCIDSMLAFTGDLLPSVLGVIGTNRWSDKRNTVTFSGYRNHPEWNSRTIKNDAGVLFMDQKLKPGKGVAPIPINYNVVGEGHWIYVTGWGTTSLWGSVPDKLQLLFVKAISPQHCAEEVKKAQQWGPSPQVDPAVEICTMHKLGAGNGMCHGDSGSALVDKAGKQVGIVSWGWPCALGIPDIHARISGFIDFLKAILGSSL